MSKTSIIALLTDFGLQDVYVGVMKAAIAGVNQELQTIDLTHQIPPQNIAAARFCLMDAYPYLPEKTVCLAVVDPGVGSKRRAIAIELENSFLVGADNGLFSGILSLSIPLAVVELTNSKYWRTDRPSHTFHGRDIFAPVAAHLASGVPLKNLGKAIAADSLVRLDIPECQITGNTISGSIQYIDRFGNLVTNIPGSLILDRVDAASKGEASLTARLSLTLTSCRRLACTQSNRSDSLVINQQKVLNSKTYSDVAIGEIVTLIGSHGWLEIAVNGGNAKERLQLSWGDRIILDL